MRFSICGLFMCFALLLPGVSFGAYGNNIELGVQWLSNHQNSDGSWGDSELDRFIPTVEAVQALRAAGRRNAAYYRGITWLENHAADNCDFLARQALALNSHGDDASTAVTLLESYQNTGSAGHAAWGVSPAYLQSPLDTAVVLHTLSALGTGTDLGEAIAYLKANQLTGADKGWVVGLGSTSDALTTAMVVKALAPLQSQDPSLSVTVANAVATLGANVNSGSPVYLQALAARAAKLANASATAGPLFTNLATTQSADGSWSSGRAYDTALALWALAAADNRDTGAGQTPVGVSDPGLRAAINASLGRNAMDSIDRTELEGLTELLASGMGISDLTGLEWAVNLTHADLRNNHITSTAQLDNLTQLVNLQLDGNPVIIAQTTDEDIPTLPEWGVIIMASLLAGIAVKQQQQMGSRSS